jgi:hypothetical protein
MLAVVVINTPLFGQGGTRGSDSPGRDIQGYAGPGWSVLFGPEGYAEMSSLGPVMFRISESGYLGPAIAYEESGSEGPGAFLGGMKAEYYLEKLSRGFYSTSAGISLLAGAGDINTVPLFTARIDAELNANFHLFPAFILAAGPMVSLRRESEDLAFLAGFTFSLKEGAGDIGRPLVRLREGGPRVGGYWQGLWLRVKGRTVFVDGGGTRLELPSGLAFGITGGVLRQRVEQGGSDLAVMLTGVTAGWNEALTPRLTLAPRLTAGLAFYGWAAPDGGMDGGPHVMIRPELCAYLGVLPFMAIGGGIGWQFVPGEAETAIPLGPLSSFAFSIQARVGRR